LATAYITLSDQQFSTSSQGYFYFVAPHPILSVTILVAEKKTTGSKSKRKVDVKEPVFINANRKNTPPEHPRVQV